MVQHPGKALRREDLTLGKFLAVHEVERGQLKEILRTRSFAAEHHIVVGKALNYLNGASSQLKVFESARDLNIKTDFLKSLVRAWEIADATGTFNGTTLSAYSRINEFSTLCLEKIAKSPGDSAIPRPHKLYWQEVARAGLIHVAELYRSQRLNLCVRELNRLVRFVEEDLKDEEMLCDGILGQLFYFSSKANRYDGRLDVAENDLVRAVDHYSRSARRLAEKARVLEGKDDARSKDELRDVHAKLGEVTLRTGVVEVSRAWLYFSQCDYKGAKHSAHAALLLLSLSRDELTQYHARLVSAAVDRVTSRSALELDSTVTKLAEIREYFRERQHGRLRARTEYELLLALILLDSTLETFDHPNVKNKTPLRDAQRYLRQRSAHGKDRWHSLKLTLHSRILRHAEMKKDLRERDFAEAIEKAEQALELAKTLRNQNCQIEALIACGEAHFEDGVMQMSINGLAEQGEVAYREWKSRRVLNLQDRNDSFSPAKKILSEALALCLKTNFPELTAIVRLLLARIAIRVNLYDEAEYHLHEFARIGLPEHAWIQRLRQKVFSEYGHEDQLVLKEEQLTKREAYLALHRFLIAKAEDKAKKEKGKITEDAVAGNIQISRETLKKWRLGIGVLKPSAKLSPKC